MSNFFLSYLCKKYSFYKFKKKKNLIIGMAHSKILVKLLGIKKTEIVCLNNYLNFYLLILLFVKMKRFNQVNYYTEAIKLVNPNLIISSIDTNPSFYKLKNNFPEKKFISIQNGVRINSIIKIEKNLKCDVVFCHGNKDVDYYKKRINSEVVPLGSIKNNTIPNYKTKQHDCISYISQFRVRNENDKIKYILGDKYYSITWKDYIQSEKKLIIFLNKYCKKNKIKFYIVGVNFDSSIEKQWYNDLLKTNKINFVSRTNSNTSYNFLQKSKLIVCMHSTLGYEFLAREKKIIFFSRVIKNAKKLNNEIKFGWPFIKNTKGFFYTNKITENEINKLIKNTNNCSQSKWLKKINFVKKQIMIYDHKNSIFKKKISELK